MFLYNINRDDDKITMLMTAINIKRNNFIVQDKTIHTLFYDIFDVIYIVQFSLRNKALCNYLTMEHLCMHISIL